MKLIGTLDSPYVRRVALWLTGLALAACEKSGQLVYERRLRPAEKWHAPWVDRVTRQLLAAYGLLEQELADRPPPAGSTSLRQADISIAVAWYFTQQTLPEVVPRERFERLTAFSAAAESLPEFRAAPYGESTVRQRSFEQR